MGRSVFRNQFYALTPRPCRSLLRAVQLSANKSVGLPETFDSWVKPPRSINCSLCWIVTRKRAVSAILATYIIQIWNRISEDFFFLFFIFFAIIRKDVQLRSIIVDTVSIKIFWKIVPFLRSYKKCTLNRIWIFTNLERKIYNDRFTIIFSLVYSRGEKLKKHILRNKIK